MKLSETEMERAWSRRDAEFDGLFYFAVRTTGIFCRPSCPSKPKRENIQFFREIGDAVRSGFRPCKRCQPELANGQPPDWVEALMQRVRAEPNVHLKADDLREAGVSPERARRWFQANYGMTFAAWARGIRLSNAFTKVRKGDPLDDIVLDHGFDSYSGFREAFAKQFGDSPGRARVGGDSVRVKMLETPLGSMLAGATEAGICLLEFVDRRGLERSFEQMRKHLKLPVTPGETAILAKFEAEVAAWFAGKLQKFEAPLIFSGSEFQEKVWRALIEIPYGETRSYREIADEIGKPTGARAVARAVGSNRIYLAIPCHRVVRGDGSLSGYGGGLWRKQAILDLERDSID
ncbi:MAG: AraC family transcriptional regulator of adaptative response [Verrucomicrobiales bacterium]|jgi:AraC family transcriptional regulator of adaptative response/methylated-DNA-[protein]-cysteine methyltransferase